MQKRGMEIISVLLLISLVVILAAAVYIFAIRITKEGIGETEQDEECFKANIKIQSACYNSNDIIIKVENQNPEEIDNGFLIRIFGDQSSVIPSPPLTKLEGLNIQEIIVPYHQAMGTLNEVEVIPKIKKENEEQSICSLQAAKISLSSC